MGFILSVTLLYCSSKQYKVKNQLRNNLCVIASHQLSQLLRRRSNGGLIARTSNDTNTFQESGEAVKTVIVMRSFLLFCHSASCIICASSRIHREKDAPDRTKKRFFVKKELSFIGREQTMQHVRKQVI